MSRFGAWKMTLALLVSLLLAGAGASHAATTATWDNGANSSNQDKWGTSSQQKKNWSGNKAPSKAKDVAIFDGAGNSGIELVKDVKVGELRFDSPLGYSFTGTKKLTFDGDNSAELNVTAGNTGSHELGFNIKLNDALVIDHQGAGTVTLSGAISGSKDITHQGSGTTVLSSTGNSFTGAVYLNGGTLALGADNVLPDSTSVSVSAGTLEIADHDDSIASLALAGGNISGTGTLTVGSFDYTGGISEVDVDVDFSSAADGFTMDSSSADVLTIGKKLKHHGKTRVKKGKLKLKGANSLPNSNFIEVSSGAELDVTAAPSGELVLNSGQTLGGSGTITGDVILAAGSALAPGNSPGILTLVGNQTWEGGASLDLEFDNATGTQGVNWDLVDIIGSVSITATDVDPFTIYVSTLLEGTDTAGEMSNFDGFGSYSWLITQTTGGISGFSADAFSIDTTGVSNAGSGTYSLSVVGTNLYLNYTPEPGTGVLVALGLGNLALRRRRARGA